jgi:hypothetical protein
MTMKPLIIIGSAPCVGEDLAVLDQLMIILRQAQDERNDWAHHERSAHPEPVEGCIYMLIGLDSVDKFLGPVQYLVTFHPDDLPACLQRRAAAGGNTDYKVISHLDREKHQPGVTYPLVDIVHPYEPPTGSSSLLGVLYAIKLGYQRIILAGCPLDVKPYITFQKGWQAHLDKYVGKVRSLSGWTREFLGYPTEEWLDVSAN